METLFSILKTIGILLVVVLSFNVIIFVHELGHFLAARWRGLVVDRFQIWFGKPIWKKTINGVQYGLGWIPAGGFVALPQMAPMESIEGENEDRTAPLPPISPLDKIIVAFAGPLFSFLLALTAAIIVWFAGKPSNTIHTRTVGYIDKDMPAAASGLMVGDTITAVNGQPVNCFAGNLDGITEQIIFSKGKSIQLTIERPGVGTLNVDTNFSVSDGTLLKRSGMRRVGISPANPVIVQSTLPGSPGERAGYKPGDHILEVDGQPIFSTAQFSQILTDSKEKTLQVKIKRGEQQLTLPTTALIPSNGFKIHPDKEPLPMLGISYDLTAQSKTLLTHPGPWQQITDSGRMLWVTLDRLTSKESSINLGHLSGPVGIGKMKYHMLLDAEFPWRHLLYFWVLFNVNLAIFNMLPFPVLDGGHITMAIMEWVRKKPLNTRVLEVIQTGFVFILLGLFAYVTMKDTFNSITGEEPSKKDSSGPAKPEWDLSKIPQP